MCGAARIPGCQVSTTRPGPAAKPGDEREGETMTITEKLALMKAIDKRNEERIRHTQVHGKERKTMKANFNGITVKIPKGFKLDSNGFYINGHGVEYALVQYGRGDETTICLETVYSRHVRTIKLERV